MEEIICYCGHTMYCDCGPEEMNQELNPDKLNMTEQTIKFRDPVVQCVVNKFVDRSDIGFAKYKMTLRADQSDVFVWLNHLQEELMDATLYLQRLKEEISTLREEKALLKEINDIDVIDAVVFEVKKKQSKDSTVTKKKRNGHGRNFTIQDDMTDLEWQEEVYKHFASDVNPFEGFLTTITTPHAQAK